MPPGAIPDSGYLWCLHKILKVKKSLKRGKSVKVHKILKVKKSLKREKNVKLQKSLSCGQRHSLAGRKEKRLY